MQFRKYLKHSLLLPYIFSSITALLTYGFGIENIVIYAITLSILIGGVPYTLFVIIMTWLIRRLSDRQLKVLTPILPLLFMPFLTIFALLISGGSSSFSDVLPFYIYGLGFGYGYVLLITLGWLIAKKLGLTSKTTESA